MRLKIGVLISSILIGSIALAGGGLQDRPGKSVQLEAFLPAAPEGWREMPGTLGTPELVPAFPWALRLFDTPDGVVSVHIVAGVHNGTFREVQKVLDNPELTAQLGLSMIDLKGRKVVVAKNREGRPEFAVNLGRDITVLVGAKTAASGIAILKRINLDALASLEP